jgi:UPF0755 protein
MILGAVILCILIVIFAVVGWYRHALKPVASTKQPSVHFTVQRGESVSEVAANLHDKGLIRSTAAFLYYYRGHHQGGGIQAGNYLFSPTMTPALMISQMVSGKVIPNAITVTIPEGFNVKDIANRLQSAGVCKASAFMEAEQHGQFKQGFVAQLAGRAHVLYRFEGFLFPDTYDFQPHEKAQDVINEMLDDFQRRVLTKSNLQAMKKQNITLNQLITKASLVENEAQVNKERPLIASVINNRLSIHMELQIDATVEYALGHHVDVVTDADTKIKSVYNTYMVNGLPPGPIDSPGLKSIDAVLHPAHTKYLYYVAKGDGSGEHYFAKTYAQQLHDESLYEENLAKHK